MKGTIIGITGPTVTVDLADLKLYDRLKVGHAGLQGEVVRLAGDHAVVQVYEETKGLGLGEPAQPLGVPLSARLGPGLMGQVYDGLQRPLPLMGETFGPFIRPGCDLPSLPEDKGWPFTPLKKVGDRVAVGEALGFVRENSFTHALFSQAGGVITAIAQGDMDLRRPVAELDDGRLLHAAQDWPIRTPRPFRRKLPPTSPLITGQRVIDFFFPLALGGTAIIPGGFGTGKTILEQTIAKHAAVDVVVYVGCGERGNEMAEMLEEFASLSDPWSGRPLAERTIMVANTSNMSVAAREASIYTAVTMAEYYRDMGCHVLLLADSISRWAEALREVSSALEEMPGEEGYPTYLASRLSGYFSRAGVVETLNGTTGSLSMILSVSPPGGDFSEPTTQACLRASGAFYMLDTALAHRRHFPAIHWGQSYSLYGEEVGRHCTEAVCRQWVELRKKSMTLLQKEEKLREVSEIVGAEGLQDEDHFLLHAADRIRSRFLCQNSFSEDAFSAPAQTAELIALLVRQYEQGAARLAQGEDLAVLLREMR
ncbi:MAG: V-type ATP synthase subunit A [Proteobacteria bacterium]|nr:V-type ATP synthase subunit A [Pseudomonadota bacterium]MBU1449217.1 V-type ATP synthase subunit A [Patescibacteria group bacterium]MBU2618730.1 V-type ATP synthase subunit A [Pseudomonadota bacterium]